MRKLLLVTALLIGGIVSVYADQESWTSAGVSFGNAFEFNDGHTTYLGSVGIHISGYGFLNNKNIGAFGHISRVFPVVTNGNEQHYNLMDDLLLGMGFRYSFTKDVKLYGGLGLDILFIRGSSYNKDASSETDFSVSIDAYGLGGDIGVKYDITDYLHVNFGCTAAYLFTNTISVRSYSKQNNEPAEYIRKDDATNDYSLLTVRPYISIGFNYYSAGKTATLGKPDK